MINPKNPPLTLSRTFDPQSIEGARSWLSSILLKLPPGQDSAREIQELAAAYAKWGTPDPLGSFVAGPGTFVENPDVLSNGEAPLLASFLVWDSDDYSLPYQALLEYLPTYGWTLNWLVAQCASCFGTGTADREICGTCGGSGWGTLNSVERPYSPRRPTGRRLHGPLRHL